MVRRCSRPGCQSPAVATLTYVYADSTAVLGPLATYAEPHSYDLCSPHAERLTVPRGWDAVRLSLPHTEPAPSSDDLEALADAVREAARTPSPSPSGLRAVPDTGPGGRRPGRYPGAGPGDSNSSNGSGNGNGSGPPAGRGRPGESTGGAPDQLGQGRPPGTRRGHLRVLSNEP